MSNNLKLNPYVSKTVPLLCELRLALLQSPRYGIHDSSSSSITKYHSLEAHITAPAGHQPYTGAACLQGDSPRERDPNPFGHVDLAGATDRAPVEALAWFGWC